MKMRKLLHIFVINFSLLLSFLRPYTKRANKLIDPEAIELDGVQRIVYNN